MSHVSFTWRVFSTFPLPAAPPTLKNNGFAPAVQEEQPTGYELLSWHNGVPRIGGQTPEKYRDPAAALRRTSSDEHLPTVEYTKIDELKTNALHAAMSQHKRGDASFTARAAADSDDEFGFGLCQEASSSSLDTYMATRGGSWHGAERPTAKSFGVANTHSPSSLRKQRQKHRRYVNVSNSQLTVVINQEKKSNGTVASTIFGGAYWGGQDRELTSWFRVMKS